MIVDLELMKAQLGITDDMGNIDDALINHAIEAAQDHIERLLGFKIEEIYGGTDQQPIPASLKQTNNNTTNNAPNINVSVSGGNLSKDEVRVMVMEGVGQGIQAWQKSSHFASAVAFGTKQANKRGMLR